MRFGFKAPNQGLINFLPRLNFSLGLPTGDLAGQGGLPTGDLAPLGPDVPAWADEMRAVAMGMDSGTPGSGPQANVASFAPAQLPFGGTSGVMTLGDSYLSGPSRVQNPGFAEWNGRPTFTPLTQTEDQRFVPWMQSQGRDPVQEAQAGYDMPGYFKGVADRGQSERGANGHYPDTYKLPWHPTFSNESQYATPDAPHWSNDRLFDKHGRMIADENTQLPQQTVDYLAGRGVTFFGDPAKDYKTHPAVARGILSDPVGGADTFTDDWRPTRSVRGELAPVSNQQPEPYPRYDRIPSIQNPARRGQIQQENRRIGDQFVPQSQGVLSPMLRTTEPLNLRSMFAAGSTVGADDFGVGSSFAPRGHIDPNWGNPGNYRPSSGGGMSGSGSGMYGQIPYSPPAPDPTFNTPQPYIWGNYTW